MNRGNFNIPPQYRSDVTCGENVKAMAAVLYGEGVMANDRIAAFLNSASGDVLELSEGSIYGFCKRLSENAAESIAHLESSLLDQAAVATDATTVTVNGRQNYIRNFSTDGTIVYHAMKQLYIILGQAMRNAMPISSGIFVKTPRKPEINGLAK